VNSFLSAAWADENRRIFSSATATDENTLFSSAADEKEPIFVEFISSAYFRREADENNYFCRHWVYFRRLLADENMLFSYL
jgi:hypothetical protein